VKKIFTCFILFFSLTSHIHGQIANQYIIDKSVQREIFQKNKSGLSILNTKWLVDGEPNGFLSGNKQFHTFWGNKNDTAIITFGRAFYPWEIVSIYILNDSLWSNHFVSSNDQNLKNFKFTKEQEDFQFSINVPPQKLKLVLIKKPEIGEDIEGYVEFESVEFYQRSKKADKKRSYSIKGFFRANNIF
jgi:hypothetical protein